MIELLHTRPRDHEAISIEQAIKRKIMRRRRVAKRMLKRFPMMAVEFMQSEFPGYTYEEWVADVTRKTRKSKSFRRSKEKQFDWTTIRKEIPEFFSACRRITKTKAVLYGRRKDGERFTCVVRAVWWSDYGEQCLRTSDLIRLWKGPLKTFLSHPAMQLYEQPAEILTH